MESNREIGVGFGSPARPPAARAVILRSGRASTRNCGASFGFFFSHAGLSAIGASVASDAIALGRAVAPGAKRIEASKGAKSKGAKKKEQGPEHLLLLDGSQQGASGRRAHLLLELVA